MTYNDILRRLRYALDVSDDYVVRVFGHGGCDLNADQVRSFMRREDHEGFTVLSAPKLCCFLDGLIVEKRGPRADGSAPEVQEYLSNNEILKKLRIALSLRDEDMMAVFKLADFVVTKAELGSFFRRQEQRNFRKCPEQVVRKFIKGLAKGNGLEDESSED